MGAAASAVASEELEKPLDGSDIADLDAGRAEVARLRKLLKTSVGLEKPCIIACTDGSKDSELAFDIALTLRPPAATMEVLNVKLADEQDDLYTVESIKSNFSAKMVARGVPDELGKVVFEEQEDDEPAKQAIVRYVNAKGYGKVLLVAMGFRGRDRPMGDVSVMVRCKFEHLIMPTCLSLENAGVRKVIFLLPGTLAIWGSSTDLATRDADCAGLIVKAGYSKMPEEGKPTIFCLAVDGSENADEAVRLLKRVAKPEDKIYTMMIDDGQLEANPERKERKEDYEKDESLIFELKMKGTDSISQTIMDYADEKEAHFLCCGCDGIGGYKKSSLGSVAEYLVQNWKGSVLVARLPSDQRVRNSTVASAAEAATSPRSDASPRADASD